MRCPRVLLAALLASAAALPASAESYTTRIEPNAFYGATVTLEHGVRVIRPLPAVRHVIVNPGGLTPLQLSHTDVRSYAWSQNEHYHTHAGTPAATGGGAYYYSGLPARTGGHHPRPRGHGGGHHR